MDKPQIGGCDFCSRDNVEVVDIGIMGPKSSGFCACKDCCDKCNHPWPNGYLPCPICGSNSQIWINQVTGKPTCHRAGCHIEVEQIQNKKPHISCHQCGKMIVAELTNNGVGPCWLGHCCGFGQDAAIGSEVYLEEKDESQLAPPPPDNLVFRIWNKEWKQYIDDPKRWGESEANLKHLEDHLFVGPTGRVFWLQHDGLKELTNEVEIRWQPKKGDK